MQESQSQLVDLTLSTVNAQMSSDVSEPRVARCDQSLMSDETVIELTSLSRSTLDNHIDGAPVLFNYEFLLSMIDPRPIFIPMSKKRSLWLSLLFSVITGLTYVSWNEDLVSKFREFASQQIIPLMVFIFGYEPAMLVLYMLFSHYPEHTSVNAETVQLEENFNPNRYLLEPDSNPHPELVILIPCHNSAAFIDKTVHACLRHVSPMQILILDNGKGEVPSDNTREIVHAIHPRIHYFYLPKTGNKTIALLLGAQYVMEKLSHLKQALIIDDDTLLPLDFSVRQEFFTDSKVKGIVYPIRAGSPYKKEPLVSRHQDIEYKIADLEMAFLDRANAVMRPHGAASLWLIDPLVMILRKHNAIFGGEDIMMGLLLKYINFDGGIAQLKLDLNCYFKTIVPQSYFGDQPNLCTQRVAAWNEAQYLYLWNLVFKPLLSGWRQPLLTLLLTKNSQLYNLYTQFIYLIKYPMIAILANQPFFWKIFAGTKCLELLMILMFNYLKIPDYLRSDFVAVFTYPLYKEATTIFGTFSAIRAALVSGPDASHPRSLQYRLEHHLIDLPPVIPINSDDIASTLLRREYLIETDQYSMDTGSLLLRLTSGEVSRQASHEVIPIIASTPEGEESITEPVSDCNSHKKTRIVNQNGTFFATRSPQNTSRMAMINQVLNSRPNTETGPRKITTV